MANPVYIWPDHVLTLTTPPAALVSTADAKKHCRVDHSDDDDYIDGLVSAAQAMLDGPSGMVGKAIATQGWTLSQARLMGKTRLPIPVTPFRDVVSLKYYDADNTQQTADLADFVVFGNEDFGYIEPLTAWPAMYDRPDAIELVFNAGYGTPAEAPKTIIHAAKLMIGHWYEHREQVLVDMTAAELPLAVYDLVNVNRIGWVRG
jgi:uncharacterized phiE125 gp8 family phage protein